MSSGRLVHRLCQVRRLAARVLPFLCAAAAASTFLALPSATADEHAAGPVVLRMALDREVEPVLASYIDDGIADAASRHAALVLITMDTPGGLSSSMTEIVQHILSSPVPVAVYVWPTGSRGASAGFFILLSADIAAMAATPGRGGGVSRATATALGASGATGGPQITPSG